VAVSLGLLRDRTPETGRHRPPVPRRALLRCHRPWSIRPRGQARRHPADPHGGRRDLHWGLCRRR
jgi:hypothetical protein